MMFERVLFRVLTEQLRALAANPLALQRFVETLPLDTALGEHDAVREIIKAFAAQQRPVIHGYARTETEFPVWAIIMPSEQEDLRPLGDESDDDDELKQPIRTSLWNSTFQILCYSQSADVTIYLYSLLRALLIETRRTLIDEGDLTNISSLQGGDLSPNDMWLPEFLFVRALSLTAQGEQRSLQVLAAQAQPLPARQITGLHLEDPRVPEDGLRHRVTTYRGEE